MDDERLFRELRDAVDASPRADLGPRPGSTWAGLEVLRSIHQGGQGTVFEARDAQGRRLALKVITGERTITTRDRLLRERRLADRLDHPGLVPLRDVGVHEGQAYCTMELVDGVRLDEWREAQRPSNRRLLELFRRVVEAVAHAHAAGVVHRDLKPSNVLVQAGDTPRVVDFGVARPLDQGLGDTHRITRTGEFLGTLAYAAPEQVAAEGPEPGPAADVYALGVMLYEALGGQLPLAVDGRLGQAVRAITTEIPAPLQQHCPTLRPSIAALVEAMLIKDPRRRIPDALRLLEELDRAEAGESPRVPSPASPSPLPPEDPGPRPSAIPATKSAGLSNRSVAVSLVSMVLAAAFWLWFDREETPSPDALEGELASALRELLAGDEERGMRFGLSRIEVLEDVLARLDEDTRAHPDLEAAVALRMAEVCLQHLQPGQAQQLAIRALDCALLSGDAEAAARCRGALGEAQTLHGDPAAVPTLREALLHHESRPDAPARSLGLARLRLARALTCVMPDGLDEADELLRAAEPLLRSAREPALRLRWEHAQAMVRWARGELAAARIHLDHAHDHSRADPLGGGVHGIVAALDHAALRSATEDAPPTEAPLPRSLFSLYDPTRLGPVLQLLARRQLQRDDASGADRLLREALRHELKLAELEAADLPTTAALDRLLASAEPGTYEIARLANLVAKTRRMQGRTTEARAVLQRSLRAGCRLLGDDCPYRLIALELRAGVDFDEGQVADALSQIDATLKRRREAGVSRGEEALEALCLAIRARRDQGLPSDALRNEARDILRGAVPERRRWLQRLDALEKEP